jgi:hypothetical protein
MSTIDNKTLGISRLTSLTGLTGLASLLCFTAIGGLSSRVASADMSSVTANEEAFEEHPVENASTAQVTEAHTLVPSEFSASELMMVLGPSVNNLAAKNPAYSKPGAWPGAGAGTPPDPTSKKAKDATGANAGASTADGSSRAAGYSLRHVFSMGYALNPSMVVGPVLDASQQFYGDQDAHFILNDPQLRLVVKDVGHAGLFGEIVRHSLWFSVYFPVSDMSRETNAYGSGSASWISHMQFRKSALSLTGLASLKTGLYGKADGSGDLISTRGFGGLQGSYRLSRVVEPFIMQDYSVSFGPQVQMSDPGLAAEAAAHGSHALGMSTGMRIEATRKISISPRLNWFYDQPIQTTTVSVAAMFQLL